MDEKYIIEPDTKFIKEVIEQGGESLKKCFQCSTCTVVCSLSPEERPFPRKEMIWAQWGLKDRLLKDPDVWLCHQCTDCSTNCPRGAKPGDVLAAIRSYSILRLVLPGFIAEHVSKFTYLLFILPILVFLWLLPITYVPTAFFIVAGLALIVAIVGMMRFWKNINEFESKPASGLTDPGGGAELAAQTKKGFFTSFFSALVDILKHNNFQKCEANQGNRLPHLLTFYGFISIVISHLADQLYPIAGVGLLPAPLTDPFKILGNLGALAVLIGLTIIIYRRFSMKDDVGKATYFDWFFVMLAYLVTLTGIATESFRLAGAIAWVHWLYLAHLVLLFTLIAYAPFSKLAHLFYRTLAMTYAKQIGRELGSEAS